MIIILSVLIAGLAAIFLFLKNRLSAPKNDEQALLMLQNQISEINRTVDSKLGESTQMLQRQFGESARIIKEITQELTKVGEGQKQVVDIAKQLENLQDILKNPKQRGVLGEYYLKTVLENVLGPANLKCSILLKTAPSWTPLFSLKTKLFRLTQNSVWKITIVFWKQKTRLKDNDSNPLSATI